MSAPSRSVPLWPGVVAVIALGGLLAWLYGLHDRGWVDESEPSEDVVAKSFDGSSEKLSQTQIVPTLDTPITEGKSAVWCSSFQLAWNEFGREVVKGPVRINNAGDIVDRLNRAKASKDDLEPGSYYVAAGLVAEGILDRVRREMAERFPDVSPPEFNPPPKAALGYAYLRAGVRYEHTFFNNAERFLFRDSAGKETAVRSFGISDKEKFKDGGGSSFRGQVAILWREGKAFAVDLSKNSSPNQVILIRMGRGATLAEMLQTHNRRLGERTMSLGEEDTLLVPVMHWRVEHHFHELEGLDRTLEPPGPPGIYLSNALQVIEFKMDRRGAEVASEARMGFDNGGPTRYHFDQPFLIVMTKRPMRTRDVPTPFFVMWVDNAELLSR